MAGNGYNRRYTPLDVPGLFDTDNVFDRDTDEWVLQWSLAEKEWNYVLPATLGGTINLGELKDVTLTPDPANDNDTLQWNGSAWVNRSDVIHNKVNLQPASAGACKLDFKKIGTGSYCLGIATSTDGPVDQDSLFIQSTETDSDGNVHFLTPTGDGADERVNLKFWAIHGGPTNLRGTPNSFDALSVGYNSTGRYQIQSIASGAVSLYPIVIQTKGNDNQIYLDPAATGLVGINTNNPTYQLDVDGSIGLTGSVVSDDGNGKIQFGAGVTALGMGYDGSIYGIFLDGNRDFNFKHDGTGNFYFNEEDSSTIDFRVGSVGAAEQALLISGATGNATFGYDLSAVNGTFTGDVDCDSLIISATANSGGSVGSGAIFQPDTNTAIFHTFGEENLFIGAGSGNSTLSGVAGEAYRNLGIGALTLPALTGTAALEASFNIALGYQALNKITTGSQNMAIGYRSFWTATDATANVGIGSQSGAAVTGSTNLAMGGGAMQFMAACSNNVAVGGSAMRGTGGTKNGSYNVAVGSIALDDINTGSYNVGIGYLAGSKITTGAGNVCIGYASGFTNTTNSYGICIGNLAGYRQTASNILVIDSRAAVLGTSQLEKENAIIYGEMASAASSQNLWLNADTTIGNSVTAQPLTVTGVTTLDSYLNIKEQASAPTNVTDYGQIWTQSNNNLYFMDGDGEQHVVHGYPVFKSYNVTTQGLGLTPEVYAAGYYDFSTTDANLTQASTSITYGGANDSYAAHTFVVPSGAGSVDTGTVGLRVTGTSIDDAGNRVGSDTEVITTDITTLTANTYYEQAKWLGTVTFELYVTSGSPTTYSLDFNYGFAKYEDWGNKDFTVTDLEVVGLAGNNASDCDFTLVHHKATGWTYSAGAFSPPFSTNAIVSMKADHAGDNQLGNGNPFAYKRSGLTADISGSGSEGVILYIETNAVNAIEYANLHLGVEF